MDISCVNPVSSLHVLLTTVREQFSNLRHWLAAQEKDAAKRKKQMSQSAVPGPGEATALHASVVRPDVTNNHALQKCGSHAVRTAAKAH